MWNDKETNIDLLGYEKIADTILEIVKDQHLRPLTIGVYGDWGVGKSSILSLLQKRVTELPEEQRKKIHTIIFNGWLFQGYEETKSALMETIVTDLARLQPNSVKVKELALSLLRRINWLKVAKVSAAAIFTGLTGMPHPGLLGEAIEGAKKIFEKKETKTDGSGTHITVEEEEKESFLKESEKTVTSQIHAFRKEFQELIETSKIDQLIILVDDLDRCLPSAVIEILEAIRLFLFVEGTTFVISADEKMIEYAVREHFPNLPANYKDYTKNYLEKLIQIPIRIPFLNQSQTGNYIKFLMLQNYLKNDFEKLDKIYQKFLAAKKMPYDNTALSFELIETVTGTASSELKETIFVADQLSPTLAIGLTGNPRNIKRFLNTLFLRIKIGKIYGLEGVVTLNVLAKLMLLERFQPDKFEIMVNEVIADAGGVSKSIKEIEGSNDDQKDGEDQKGDIDNKFKEEDALNWAALEPKLGDLDLRPYIFVSKEKAIALSTDQDLPQHLAKLYQLLNSNSGIALNNAANQLRSISIQEATQIFDLLEAESRTAPDFKNMPKSVNGLLRVIAIHSDLEVKFLSLIDSFPHTAIGVWVISQLDGLKTDKGKAKFSELLNAWSKQTENQTLKNLATGTLNKK